jgi:hypothetical protein
MLLMIIQILTGVILMSIGYHMSMNMGNLFRMFILLQLHSRCTSMNFQTLCAHTGSTTPLLMPLEGNPEVGCTLFHMQQVVLKLPLPHLRYF